MITVYTGFPGSGKSYNLTRKGIAALENRKKKLHIIANFPIIFDEIGQEERWHYLDNKDITPKSIYRICKENHLLFREGSGLLLLDECTAFFDSRKWNEAGRDLWVEFFEQHRKMGLDIYLCTQDAEALDKRIRSLIEFEILHKNVSKYIYTFGKTLFATITLWRGQTMKGERKFFFLSKEIAERYDTFQIFSDKFEEKFYEL